MQTKGYRTTEFWTAIVAALVPVLNQYLGWHLPTQGVVAVVGPLSAYILSRGIAKHGRPTVAALPM